MKLIITNAGRQAVIDAQNAGFSGVKITQVKLGSGKYTPDASATGLQNVHATIDTVAGQAVSADQIYMTVTDSSNATYSVSEFGLYTDNGILFALYSQQETILEKSSVTDLFLSLDLTLTSEDIANISFGNTDFAIPAATTTNRGAVILSSSTDSIDESKAATPKAVKLLKDYVNSIKDSLTQLINGKANSSHSHGASDLPSATITASGITRLSNQTTSASETEAATPKAVKGLRDYLISIINSKANNSHSHGASDLPPATIGTPGISALSNEIVSTSETKSATPKSVNQLRLYLKSIVDGKLGKFDTAEDSKKLGGSAPHDFQKINTAIYNPDGAFYRSDSSVESGCIKIVMPNGFSSTMITFSVTIYQYDAHKTTKLLVSGYNYGGTESWINTSAHIICGDVNIPVRFGIEEVSQRSCIYIGNTDSEWNYPQIFITDLCLGYSSYTPENWIEGWKISFATNYFGVTSSITAYAPFSKRNLNISSSKTSDSSDVYASSKVIKEIYSLLTNHNHDDNYASKNHKHDDRYAYKTHTHTLPDAGDIGSLVYGSIGGVGFVPLSYGDEINLSSNSQLSIKPKGSSTSGSSSGTPIYSGVYRCLGCASYENTETLFMKIG